MFQSDTTSDVWQRAWAGHRVLAAIYNHERTSIVSIVLFGVPLPQLCAQHDIE